MKKLLLSSVMMVFLCAVSFAQADKQASKLAARTEALKQAQLAQTARDQEKILEVQNAKNSTNAAPQLSVEAINKIIAKKLASEQARNRSTTAAAALTDPRAN